MLKPVVLHAGFAQPQPCDIADTKQCRQPKRVRCMPHHEILYRTHHVKKHAHPQNHHAHPIEWAECFLLRVWKTFSAKIGSAFPIAKEPCKRSGKRKKRAPAGEFPWHEWHVRLPWHHTDCIMWVKTQYFIDSASSLQPSGPLADASHVCAAQWQLKDLLLWGCQPQSWPFIPDGAALT